MQALSFAPDPIPGLVRLSLEFSVIVTTHNLDPTKHVGIFLIVAALVTSLCRQARLSYLSVVVFILRNLSLVWVLRSSRTLTMDRHVAVFQPVENNEI
jgi:hypothetical protein